MDADTILDMISDRIEELDGKITAYGTEGGEKMLICMARAAELERLRNLINRSL